MNPTMLTLKTKPAAFLLAGLALSILLLPFQPQAAERKQIDRLRIVVGNESLTQNELNAYRQMEAQQLAARYSGKNLERKLKELDAGLLDTMVENLLLQNEAARLGMNVSDKEIDERLDRVRKLAPQMLKTMTEDTLKGYLASSILTKQVVEREVTTHIHVGDKELIDYCLSGAKGQKEIHVGHILIRDGSPAGMAKAEKLRKSLMSGAKFEDVASAYSEDPSAASNKGDLGFATQGSFVPEFEAVAFELEPGEISEPVRTQFGIHLIKVFSSRQKKADDCTHLDELAKQQMTQLAYQLQWQERKDKFMAGLKEKTHIQVYP